MQEYLGRYRREREIGRGAMGVVYRGLDPDIGRSVALKVLSLPQGISPERAEELRLRFLREARAAGALVHPGIVGIYDVGRAEDGTPFIVMEHLEGGALSDTLREDPPDPDVVLRRGAQLARALDAAHRSGIVHRDVKPSNLLFTATGELKLADFGIARFTESELTRSGAMVGSPSYMAPEQVAGRPSDARCDIYALCAVLYRWITGRAPHTADDLHALLYRISHDAIDPPSSLREGLPPAVDAVLLRGLARDPKDRYPDAASLAEDLEKLAEGLPPAAAQKREARPLKSSRPTHLKLPPWRWIAALGLAAALLGIVGGVARFRRVEPAPGAPLEAAVRPVVQPARLVIDISHRLRRARAKVLVDGKVVAERALGATARQAALLGKEATERLVLTVAPGRRKIEIRIESGSKDEPLRASLVGDFKEAGSRQILAEVRRVPRRLDLAWK